MNVIADPKAIAARKGSGKVVQNVFFKETKRDLAIEWRKAHGLTTMPKQRD
jgi:hypothetical protein